MKIKFLSFILVILMLLPLATSCNNGKDEETTPGTTEITGDVLPEKVLLADNGSTQYKLIRSEFVTSGFYSRYTEFSNKLKEVTGTSFSLADDFVRKGTDTSESLEIIFGTTNRAECKELYSEISYDGYAVKKVGNKIIIAAYEADLVDDAVKAFFEECIEVVEENGAKKTYFVKNIVGEGTEKPFFNKDNPISEYKIVYDEDAEDAAKAIAKRISTYTNIELEVVSDRTAVTEKEILVGNTNRSESKGKKEINKREFLIKTAGTKVVIRVGDAVDISDIVDIVASNYMKNAPDFNFPASLNVVRNMFVSSDRTELSEGADFRVMSFNILSEEWTDEAKNIEERAIGVVECISAYAPDVIGIQEVSVKWYGILKRDLGDEYEFVNTDANGKTNGCYTGLAYKKSTVNLIEKELTYYSVYNNKRLRVINMGLFEMKDSGKRFIVTDTHFNANHKDAETENKNRVQQATEFIAKIDKYRKMYNCPIIMTGDYNCREDTEPYNVIESDKLIFSSKHNAQTKGERATETSIDHIFYTGAVTPLYYTTIVDAYVINSSDHKAIFSDFKFN